jgi:hypothetical protein
MQKLFEGLLAVLIVIGLMAIIIAIPILSWMGVFWLIGWFAPETSRTVLDAVGLVTLEPWQAGFLVGVVMLAVGAAKAANRTKQG